MMLLSAKRLTLMPCYRNPVTCYSTSLLLRSGMHRCCDPGIASFAGGFLREPAWVPLIGGVGATRATNPARPATLIGGVGATRPTNPALLAALLEDKGEAQYKCY